MNVPTLLDSQYLSSSEVTVSTVFMASGSREICGVKVRGNFTTAGKQSDKVGVPKRLAAGVNTHPVEDFPHEIIKIET